MIRRTVCLIGGLLLGAQAAAAAPQWSGSVMLASNHLMRGVSRSSNDPAASAEVQAQFADGWSAGLWASTSRVRPIDAATVELAATLGFGAALNDDWALRGSYSHYESPWQYRAGFYRYNEFTVDLRFRDSLLVSASYSPDTSRYAAAYGPVWRRDATAFEASWQRSLAPGLRGHVGAGYYDLSDLFGEGYWYGSAGLSWTWRRWQLDASYVHPDRTAADLSYPGDARRRGLVTLRRTF